MNTGQEIIKHMKHRNRGSFSSIMRNKKYRSSQLILQDKINSCQNQGQNSLEDVQSLLKKGEKEEEGAKP